MKISFTPTQAKHAHELTMRLYKKRFFLPKGATSENPLPHLSPAVFEELYKLEKMFSDKYHFARLKTEAELLKLELDYGLTAPILNDSKNVVTCNRYSCGLDIVAIVPLHEVMKYCPTREIDVSSELLEARYPEARRDEVAPNTIREQARNFDEFAAKVFWELYELQAKEDFENKMVVILNTRFCPSNHKDDVMSGKIDGLVNYPHLTAYLLYKAERAGMGILNSYYTITSSSRKGHPEIMMSDRGVSLDVESTIGYDCLVSFATIL